MGKLHPSPDHGRRSTPAVVVAGRTCILMIVMIAAIGCRYGAPPPPGAVKVTGSVRFAGSALPRGTVQFGAVAGNDSGTAKIQPNGSFVVWLQPGDYRAAVIAYDGIERVDANGIPLPQNSIIPERYFTTEQSGLTASIDQKNCSVEFDLQQ